MEFEIDVSGEDILNPNYTICVANRDGLIRGFKMTTEMVQVINARHDQGLYRYKKSRSGKATLKVRLYCAIISEIFRTLRLGESVSLTVCRDFDGKEQDIKIQLAQLLKDRQGLTVESVTFAKLDAHSGAHTYAYLMRKDTKNKLPTYATVTLNTLENYLFKR